MKTPEEIFKNYFPHYTDKIYFVDESQRARDRGRFIMGADIDLKSEPPFKKIEIPVEIVLDIFKKGFSAAREYTIKDLVDIINTTYQKEK
jgi:hypothetical protein